MSVITESKTYEDVYEQLSGRKDLPIVVLGCDKCAKTSKTGGEVEVRAMREQLRNSGLMLLDSPGLVDAVEEGLCDPKAVPERLQPLREQGAAGFQVLVLACGAGLQCVRGVLPHARVVPGLNTLGPGVKGELACLACGDCRFGQDGCKMLRLAQAQANRLSSAYQGSCRG